ncbi:hypothetical protein ABPG72_020516 [Tetrahymena utriculariae]
MLNSNLVANILKITLQYFTDLITILPKPPYAMKWTLGPTCGFVNITDADRNYEKDSDLHLYVSYSDELTKPYLAYAGRCKFLKPHVNPISVQLIRYFNSTVLQTPNFQAYARQYFGCPSLAGMLLENQGTVSRLSLGNHSYKNEYMNAAVSNTQGFFSKFTTSLLRDTGFYASINSTMEEQIFYGKDAGCSFVNRTCDSQKREYCKAEVSQCDYYYFNSGICNPSSFSDPGYKLQKEKSRSSMSKQSFSQKIAYSSIKQQKQQTTTMSQQMHMNCLSNNLCLLKDILVNNTNNSAHHYDNMQQRTLQLSAGFEYMNNSYKGMLFIKIMNIYKERRFQMTQQNKIYYMSFNAKSYLLSRHELVDDLYQRNRNLLVCLMLANQIYKDFFKFWNEINEIINFMIKISEQLPQRYFQLYELTIARYRVNYEFNRNEKKKYYLIFKKTAKYISNQKQPTKLSNFKRVQVAFQFKTVKGQNQMNIVLLKRVKLTKQKNWNRDCFGITLTEHDLKLIEIFIPLMNVKKIKSLQSQIIKEIINIIKGDIRKIFEKLSYNIYEDISQFDESKSNDKESFANQNNLSQQCSYSPLTFKSNRLDSIREEKLLLSQEQYPSLIREELYNSKSHLKSITQINVLNSFNIFRKSLLFQANKYHNLHKKPQKQILSSQLEAHYGDESLFNSQNGFFDQKNSFNQNLIILNTIQLVSKFSYADSQSVEQLICKLSKI